MVSCLVPIGSPTKPTGLTVFVKNIFSCPLLSALVANTNSSSDFSSLVLCKKKSVPLRYQTQTNYHLSLSLSPFIVHYFWEREKASRETKSLYYNFEGLLESKGIKWDFERCGCLVMVLLYGKLALTTTSASLVSSKTTAVSFIKVSSFTFSLPCICKFFLFVNIWFCGLLLFR